MCFSCLLWFELSGFVLSSGGGGMLLFFLVAVASEEVFVGGDEWSIAVAVDIEGFFVHGDIIDLNNFMVFNKKGIK